MTWLFLSRRSQRLVTVVTAAFAVGWLPLPAAAQTAPKPLATDDSEAPTEVSAEQMTGRPDRELFLDRNVEITRGGTTINADHGTYWIVEDEVEANGNVRMTRFGDRYTGDRMRMKIDTGEGYALNPTYHLKETNGQGRAERIDFISKEQADVTDGTYSTCEGPDPDWYLKSNTMSLDKGRDVGTAGTTIVYFKDVPIIGTPYMSFPLSDARKSGLLPPNIGTSSKGGLELAVPYYFNIAPNRDFTFTPDYIERRGLQLGGDARYLGRNYAGETKFEYLNNDAETGTERYSYTTVHQQRLTPRLQFGWNISGASDDDYPDDFSRNLATSTNRLLLRDVHASYAGDFWTATARASSYQVLQDDNSPITRPYDRLPQLTLQAGRYDVGGFDWSSMVQATQFWHPDFVRGDRFVVNPKISFPIVRPGYFITPKLSLNATSYNLENNAAQFNNGRQYGSSPGFVLPTFSLDSGLIFERETSFLGTGATQTLEPRLFYVRTPFHDQSDIPVFDTAEADLSFAQIFTENRFIGNDRVSDANQLTLAMVSRFLEPSGAERLRVAFGQRFYFQDQRVTMPGVAPNGENNSDFLASGDFKLSEQLSTEANLQYSATQQTVSRANYGVSWRPQPKKVLNVIYRIDKPNALKQIDVSGQWPLGNRWYGVGRINYSLPNDYAELSTYVPSTSTPPKSGLSEGLIGLEYKADCWIFRIVAQRIPTSTGEANSTLFFQLELSGLTKLGSDPMTALRRNVPGYQTLSNSPNATE